MLKYLCLGRKRKKLVSREGRAEWAHALAGGLSVCGAEGSFAGLTANVPKAVIIMKNKI